MSQIGYAAVEEFNRHSGSRWEKYIAWSKLDHLVRAVTIDSLLCPTVKPELSETDWQHNIQRDFMLNYFLELDYLLKRVEGVKNVQIIGFVHQPVASYPHDFIDLRFEFAGYDLIETPTSVSALTNCGGFPESFSNSELNESGLISNFNRAQEIQRNLKANNPTEPYADCDIWALWLYQQK